MLFDGLGEGYRGELDFQFVHLIPSENWLTFMTTILCLNFWLNNLIRKICYERRSAWRVSTSRYEEFIQTPLGGIDEPVWNRWCKCADFFKNLDGEGW